MSEPAPEEATVAAASTPDIADSSASTSASAPASNDSAMLKALDAAAKVVDDGTGEAASEAGENTDGAPTDELTSVDDFVPTLQSDVNENVALTLLLDVQSSDSVFSIFNDDDMDRLARYLSVLSFEKDDQIITNGEAASFCGIVLSGAFHAVINESTKIPLAKGALVGEMAYFEGGKRTADILSIEPSVMAVISFSDLKKLQKLEQELVGKFLHMLAVVSIRKLRNMLKPPSTAPAEPVEEKSTEEKEKERIAKEKEREKAREKEKELQKEAAQESLFRHRLKAKEVALEANAAALEEAKRLAEESRKKNLANQKKKQEAMYKATALEARIAKQNQQYEEWKEENQKMKDQAARANQRSKLLQDQLASLNNQKVELEKLNGDLNSRVTSLLSDKDETTRATVSQVHLLDQRYNELLRKETVLRGHYDAEQLKAIKLQSLLDESRLNQESSQNEIKSLQRDIETLQSNLQISQQRFNSSEMARKEVVANYREEQGASGAWKAKAEIHLGDYTRLSMRMKELEDETIKWRKERRATLSNLNRSRNLMRKMILRNYIQICRNRKVIFDMLKRVAIVAVNSSEQMEVKDGWNVPLSSKGNTFFASSASNSLTSSSAYDTDAMLASSSMTHVTRSDRARLLHDLRTNRAAINVLLTHLDESLNDVATPLQVASKENAQLRTTLDAFFQRNISLTQHFMSAKSTYEALHVEYSRLRDALARSKRNEKALILREKALMAGKVGPIHVHHPPATNGAANANQNNSYSNPQQHYYGTSNNSVNMNLTSPHLDSEDDFDLDDDGDLSRFAASLPIPTPLQTPFSPTTTVALRNGKSYSEAFTAMNANKTTDTSNNDQYQQQQQHLNQTFLRLSQPKHAVPSPTSAAQGRKGKTSSIAAAVAQATSAHSSSLTPQHSPVPSSSSFSSRPMTATAGSAKTSTPTELDYSSVANNIAHSPTTAISYLSRPPSSPLARRPTGSPATTNRNVSNLPTAATDYQSSPVSFSRPLSSQAEVPPGSPLFSHSLSGGGVAGSSRPQTSSGFPVSYTITGGASGNNVSTTATGDMSRRSEALRHKIHSLTKPVTPTTPKAGATSFTLSAHAVGQRRPNDSPLVRSNAGASATPAISAASKEGFGLAPTHQYMTSNGLMYDSVPPAVDADPINARIAHLYSASSSPYTSLQGSPIPNRSPASHAWNVEEEKQGGVFKLTSQTVVISGKGKPRVG